MPRCSHFKRYLACIWLVFIASHSRAEAMDPADTVQHISVAMGNFEPFYIAQGETGIFTDLIRAVFKKMPGYQPRFLFGYSNQHLWHEFRLGKIDAVSNLFDSEPLQACRSDEIFLFRDLAITRKRDHIRLKTIGDLAGKRIVTYQGAKGFLGEAFANAVKPQDYQEMAKQNGQARALFQGEAEVSVGDIFIFLHSLKKMHKPGASPNDFSYHDIFPAIYSRMGFRDLELCRLFNAALKKTRDSGEYLRIYESYLIKLNYPDKLFE